MDNEVFTSSVFLSRLISCDSCYGVGLSCILSFVRIFWIPDMFFSTTRSLSVLCRVLEETLLVPLPIFGS